MNAHTRGPWAVDGEGQTVVTVWAIDVSITAPTVHEHRVLSEEEAHANATLIAAAPDLLNAAQQDDNAFTWLAEQMNSLTDNAKHWTVAAIENLAQQLRIGIEHNQKATRAAIAKAEGR
jgi:hypothetical protein